MLVHAFIATADYQLGSDPGVAPGGFYSGAGHNLGWVDDAQVGTVPQCTKVAPLQQHAPGSEPLSTPRA